MRATLGLEYIGANTADMLRNFSNLERRLGGVSPDIDLPRFGPYVARVYNDPTGKIYLREIHGKRDYSQANSKGSRGVYVWYTLNQDEIYFVRSPQSWRSVQEYFCYVDEGGEIRKLSDEELRQCLNPR